MSKLIFISSPYSHEDEKIVEENYLKVARFAGLLCSMGEVVISPIVYGHTLVGHVRMPTDWMFWKNFCLILLEKCDEMIVYKMEGWDKSRGVREEIEFATNKGIKITYRDYEEL
jgi:hypothetical protein